MTSMKEGHVKNWLTEGEPCIFLNGDNLENCSTCLVFLGY